MTTKKELIKDVEEIFGVKVTNVEVKDKQAYFYYEGSDEPITIPID